MSNFEYILSLVRYNISDFPGFLFTALILALMIVIPLLLLVGPPFYFYKKQKPTTEGNKNTWEPILTGIAILLAIFLVYFFWHSILSDISG